MITFSQALEQLHALTDPKIAAQMQNSYKIDRLYLGVSNLDIDTLYKEWLAYRKALRNLPSTTEDPTTPVWPEKPEVPTGKTEGTLTPLFMATLMTENNQLRSKVTALERKSTKFELAIIDLKRRIQNVET